MQAKDVMTKEVITVRSSTTATEIADLLLRHRISGVPVLGDGDRVVGIVSEGDLVQRIDDGGRQGSWWLRLFTAPDAAADYVKRHGRRAEDIMSRDVISVSPDAPLGEIARLLERRHIKRVPVIDGSGRLVGIISRANLLHGLAVTTPLPGAQPSDEELRERVAEALKEAPGFVSIGVNATVVGGVVELWGLVRSDDEARAARIAAENVDGVRSVEVHLGRMPAYIGAE